MSLKAVIRLMKVYLELCDMRGIIFDQSTLQRGVIRFITCMEQKFLQRKKVVSGSWRIHEPYIKFVENENI